MPGQPAHHDTCKIGTITADVLGPYSDGSTFAYGSAIRCSYAHLKGDEVADGSEMAVIDAEIRIPAGTTVNNKDHVLLTHINGTDITDKYFEIVGEPFSLTREIVLKCIQLTGGAAR